QIDDWLDGAQALHKNRKAWLPAHLRIDILNRAIALMQAEADGLALQIANEGGKPLQDAKVEVTRATDGLGLCVHGITDMKGEEIPMDLTAAGAGRIAFTQKEPIGPVVALSAFNHPLNLIVHQVGPAVAAGCPVLVKPSADTPLSCQSFVNILYEAGLPEEWCRFVMTDVVGAEKMATDERTQFLSFIGSARVGWMLRSKLAPGTRAALEHGGLAPVIVEADADIEGMIPALLKGGMYHSGQVCVSVQRVYAPRRMAADIAERVASGAAGLEVGDAIHASTECGPLIRPGEIDRVEEWVKEARDAGARVMTGGKRLGDTTYAPTVLLDPPEHVRVSTMEVFGPVICVYSTDTLDEAVARANSLPFAFQASVFTKNIDAAMNISRDLDATAVMINDHTAFRVDWMPFAGRRQSGYGTGGIAHTMHDMTNDKMRVMKLGGCRAP
ncbi:MAG: aldehyde dehydrogenase family protein, partial [Pseudomonadota bacterium]